MMREVDAFKRLAVVLGCAKSEKDVHGATVAEVVCFIADTLPKQTESKNASK